MRKVNGRRLESASLRLQNIYTRIDWAEEDIDQLKCQTDMLPERCDILTKELQDFKEEVRVTTRGIYRYITILTIFFIIGIKFHWFIG